MPKSWRRRTPNKMQRTVRKSMLLIAKSSMEVSHLTTLLQKPQSRNRSRRAQDHCQRRRYYRRWQTKKRDQATKYHELTHGRREKFSTNKLASKKRRRKRNREIMCHSDSKRLRREWKSKNITSQETPTKSTHILVSRRARENILMQ